MPQPSAGANRRGLIAVRVGQKKRSMSRLSDSSHPHRASVLLLERFDLVAIVAGDDADAGALGERRHDLAGEA
jgi:hypothetical protein